MKIEINGFTKIINKKIILDDISLTMNSGNVYGFEGRNGSGKTMLMRGICGLITPTRGSVVIDGKILGKAMSFPESVGAIIEKPGLLPYYTGFKNLKVLADINKRIGTEKIESILNRLDLFDVKDKKVKTYSLGMKQKLGIAAAIMEDPDLIILDEPFNGLDKTAIELLKEIILEEKAKGKLVILSCHDKDLLDDVSDEIIFIENGKMIV